MKSLRGTIEGIFDWIDRISIYSGYISAGLSIVLTLIVTYGVFLRYVLHNPVFWVEEISGYLFVWFFCLGIVYATLTESHISSEIVIKRLPMGVQYAVSMIGCVMAFIIALAMVYYGSKTTWTYYSLGWRSDTLLEAKLWPVWVSVPLGFAVFAIELISRIRAITIRFLTTGDIEYKETEG